jgi:sortase (surface protein transpeptidase)
MKRRYIGAVLALCAFLTMCGPEQTPRAGVIDVPATAATTAPTSTSTPTSTPTPAPTAAPSVVPATPTVDVASEVANDLPELVLSTENAPPTPAVGSAEPARASTPTRIIIPEIDLDLETVAVGVDPRGVPIVPKHEPGWFTGSAAPGQGTNVVFWGHVLRWQDAPALPAPFARLEELQPGASIDVVTADGERWSYRVTRQIRARPEDVHFLYPTLREQVTLVSCIGDKVIRDGTLTKEFRLITVAEPVS